MAHDVFLSHAVKDKTVADTVCSALESNGIRCWVAGRDIVPGIPYGKAIMDAIHDSRAMIVVFSLDANISPHVMREVERAVNRGIPILPFRIDDVPPTGSMEYFLAGQQWLDALTPPIEVHVRKLIDAVKVHLLNRDGIKILEKIQSDECGTGPSLEDEKPLSKTISRSDFIDSITGMEFVLVPGGSFDMGDTFGDGESRERPVHRVTLSPFFIGKYLVTQEQWESVTGFNPSSFRGPKLPVEKISWFDARLFIEKLNSASGGNYRLPTEAEWEYAARSGGKAEIWAGTSNEEELGGYAWFYGNSWDHPPGGGKPKPAPQPVGKKMPNALGLYDMSGNLFEWCFDWYENEYYARSPSENPLGPTSGTHRVNRGGSWIDPPGNARTTYRGNSPPSGKSSNVGIRLVKEKS